jgi:HAD superfamily hydrolase (TIGR01549 family)
MEDSVPARPARPSAAAPPDAVRPDAVLLDIDGTLVDSNYLHADAWAQAFAAAGHPVDAWRVHRAVGMDGGKLVERLIGAAAGTVGDQVQDEQGRLYAGSAGRLRRFAGARELLIELHRRGHPVVLASSAPQSELDALLPVLDADQVIDAVTTGEDADLAKPDPGIVQIAVVRAGVTADHAVLVGDAVWDMEAARRAGVRSIGVLSGGYGRDELLTAGAAAVYEDVADLLAHLDSSPLYDATRTS